MAVLQALIATLGRYTGKLLNAAFGWAVRAMFGTTTGAEGTLLTITVALAAFWPLLLIGIAAPKLAAFALAFVPLPDRVSDRAVRLVWIGLAIAIPLLLGAALAAKRPGDAPPESAVVRVLRGFPMTLGVAIAFWILLVSVPLSHLAALIRGWRDAHVPLITKTEGYWDAADRIERVLNERGFDLEPAAPPRWVRASMAALRSLGGSAMRRYVPDRIAYLVGPKLRATLHPSSLLLRGPESSTTLAHGLIVESLTPCEAFQATDPEAQEIESEIRRIWQVLEENPRAHRNSRMLASRLHDLSEKILHLEAPWDDWQTVYRKVLQLGRALGGEPQLLARAEGVEMNEDRENSYERIPREVRSRSTMDLMGEISSKATLLVKKEVELARRELQQDLRSELAMAKGLAVAVFAASATINLLLVAVVFALARHVEGWIAALCLAGGTLLVTVVAAALARRWHVEKPLSLTRKTLVEDAQWAKERMA